MNKLYIENLIADLKVNPILIPIFGDNIFYTGPLSDIANTYLSINILANNKNTCTTETLIEFKITASNTEVAPLTMQDYNDILHEQLVGGNKIYNINSESYVVESLSDFYLGKNSKNRFEIIQTYTFRYSN